MKDTSDNKNAGMKPEISPARQKVIDDAFEEMRVAQKKMNPKFLEKIRNLVRNSPILIDKLGLKKEDLKKPSAVSATPKLTSKDTDQKPIVKNPEYEKIDQAKNMDVISKMLELNPDKKDMIKKLLSDK